MRVPLPPKIQVAISSYLNATFKNADTVVFSAMHSQVNRKLAAHDIIWPSANNVEDSDDAIQEEGDSEQEERSKLQ
ncbi:hypothetical protein MFLAVUS_000053 [Mucor flavus]|uniref:F-box domain-containing protein n=1 Tax=Mucor flavus TaxID=439312 RepID=A0ABP9YIM5_9FUNG